MLNNPRYSHATKIAQKILRESDVNTIPIDVEKIASFLGLNILYYEFPEAISAVLLTEGHMTFIGVNKNHSITRQRFSIAHEIGHHAMGHYREVFIDSRFISEGDFEDIQDKYDGNQEKEANHFASELLMPSDLIKKDFKSANDVDALAKKYKVSKDALWIKIVKLKLI